MVVGETLHGLARDYAGRAVLDRTTSLRERLLAEAGVLIRDGGWSTLTMGKLADRVGVSRQTVYNEIGSKQQLAQAVVMHELSVLLSAVDRAFLENPDDIHAAIRGAAQTLLEEAERNPLLIAVLTRSEEAADLLALITTQAAPLIDAAKLFLEDHIAGYDLPLADDELDFAVDAVIRLVLSHVTQPGHGTPEEVARDIAWLARRVLQADHA